MCKQLVALAWPKGIYVCLKMTEIDNLPHSQQEDWAVEEVGGGYC